MDKSDDQRREDQESSQDNTYDELLSLKITERLGGYYDARTDTYYPGAVDEEKFRKNFRSIIYGIPRDQEE